MNHGLVKSGLFNMNVLQSVQDEPYSVVLFYWFRSLYSYKVPKLQGREHSKNTPVIGKWSKRTKKTCRGHISFEDRNNDSVQLAKPSTPKVLLPSFNFILQTCLRYTHVFHPNTYHSRVLSNQVNRFITITQCNQCKCSIQDVPMWTH
jgi:hypothetical protein